MKKFLLALFLGLFLFSCTAPQRKVALETGTFVIVIGGAALIGPAIAAGAAGVTYLFFEATEGKTVEELKQQVNDQKEVVSSSLFDGLKDWVLKWVEYLVVGIGIFFGFKYRENIKRAIFSLMSKKLIRSSKSSLNKIAGNSKKKSRK